MTTPNLTLRQTKGSALTYGELDGNFSELNTRTTEGWNDLVQDITVRTGSSAPLVSNYRDGLFLYEFSGTTMMECFVNFHMRHDYQEDGPTGNAYPGMVYPHVHWSLNTASSGTVRWGVEWTTARRHDSTGQLMFPATQTLYIEQAVTANSAYTHFVNESADGLGIPGTNLETDCLILCRVFRDAAHPNDTFPDPVYLLTADIHYPCHTLATPSRFPPFVV